MRGEPNLYRVKFNYVKKCFEVDEDQLYYLDEINKYDLDFNSFFEDRFQAERALLSMNSKQKLSELKTCKDCGKLFWLPYVEEAWFTARDMVPPKRCPSCRKKRKKMAGGAL